MTTRIAHSIYIKGLCENESDRRKNRISLFTKQQQQQQQHDAIELLSIYVTCVQLSFYTFFSFIFLSVFFSPSL
jgi:hypothetical protein